MNNLAERAAPALLVAAGLLTLMPLLPGAMTAAAATATTLQPQLAHWHFMNGLLGLGLLAAAFVPTLRVAVVSGAVLTKAGFVILMVLAPAAAYAPQDAGLDLAAMTMALAGGGLFWQAAVRHARWHGELAWRQER